MYDLPQRFLLGRGSHHSYCSRSDQDQLYIRLSSVLSFIRLEHWIHRRPGEGAKVVHKSQRSFPSNNVFRYILSTHSQLPRRNTYASRNTDILYIRLLYVIDLS